MTRFILGYLTGGVLVGYVLIDYIFKKRSDYSV